MSSIEYLASLDPEDLTAKQWRKLFRSARLMRSEKTEDEKDEETDKAAKENDDLVNLQEEKKGKSKAPKVEADDLPEGVDKDEDGLLRQRRPAFERDSEDAKPKKKGRG